MGAGQRGSGCREILGFIRNHDVIALALNGSYLYGDVIPVQITVARLECFVRLDHFGKQPLAQGVRERLAPCRAPNALRGCIPRAV